jgi:hypothetical protein
MKPGRDMRYGTRKKQPDRLEPLRSAAKEKLVRAKPAGHFAVLSRLAGSGFPARTQASAYLKITVYPGRAGVFVGLRICGTGGEFSDRPKVPAAPLDGTKSGWPANSTQTWLPHWNCSTKRCEKLRRFPAEDSGTRSW